MTDQQIDRLLTAAEAIAGSLRIIAGQPQLTQEEEWEPPCAASDDRTFDPVTKEEALAALGKSDKTLKVYCAKIGIDVKQLTVGLVEYLKRKTAERHKRPDTARRNKRKK